MLQNCSTLETKQGLIDPFGRRITYLRMSVTDRCDFRCVYCMAEDMEFLPKREVLSIEELIRLGRAFIAQGVRKIRLTGGEPLLRRNVMKLVRALGGELGKAPGEPGLDELTITTNASQLSRFAGELYGAGVRRINVSLDTLDGDVFRRLTRRGDLQKVLGGIEAALDAGLKVKINTVALRGVNDVEIPDILAWCGAKGMDLTLIETMPMGEIEDDRFEYYMPLEGARDSIAKRFQLTPSTHNTGGPARYYNVAETGTRLGLITPLSHNFCATCNRVRVTCTGRLYMCLGQDDSADLRQPLREADDDGPLSAAINEAMTRKPEGHDFSITAAGDRPAVARHMSVTGG